MKVCLGGTILNFSTLYIIYLSKILHKLNWPTKREHFNFFYFSLPILYYYFCNFSNRTTHILWIYGPQRFIICILWRSGGQVITVIKMDICILKLLIWKDKKYLFLKLLNFQYHMQIRIVSTIIQLKCKTKCLYKNEDLYFFWFIKYHFVFIHSLLVLQTMFQIYGVIITSSFYTHR